jgi:hypothetical protein
MYNHKMWKLKVIKGLGCMAYMGQNEVRRPEEYLANDGVDGE